MLRTEDTGAVSVCDHMSTLLFNIHSSLIMSYVYIIEPGRREKSSVTDAEGIYRQEEAAGGERARAD